MNAGRGARLPSVAVGDSTIVCYAWSVRRQTYTVTFFDTYCACPPKDDQAELTWMAGYAARRSPIPALTGLDVEQLGDKKRCMHRHAKLPPVMLDHVKSPNIRGPHGAKPAHAPAVLQHS